jgi:GNAT superfamily N-acetyltransferase
MRKSTTIRRVSYSEIFGAPNGQKLIDEYAAECSVPDADPQIGMYAAMEQSGALQCFGAYLDGRLIGFATVLKAVMPHHGKRVATLESLFVSPSDRDSGAGNDLLSAAEQFAAVSACEALLCTARIGSTLEKVLSRRVGCNATHTGFTRWL